MWMEHKLSLPQTAVARVTGVDGTLTQPTPNSRSEGDRFGWNINSAYLKQFEDPRDAAQPLLQLDDVAGDDNVVLGGGRMDAVLCEDVILVWDVGVAEVSLTLLKLHVGQGLELGIVNEASLTPAAHLKKGRKEIFFSKGAG